MGIHKRRQQMGEKAWELYQSERIKLKNRKRQNKVTKASVLFKQTTKLKLIAHKGGKCELCGYSKLIPGAFTFHHIDPKQKSFTISDSSKGFEAKLDEVNKCQLLCNNCHAEIHYIEYLNRKDNTLTC